METVQTFITDHTAREEERDRMQAKYHEENKNKLDALMARTGQRSLMWNIAGVIVAIAALAATILIAMVGYKVAHNEPVRISDNPHTYETMSNIPPVRR